LNKNKLLSFVLAGAIITGTCQSYVKVKWIEYAEIDTDQRYSIIHVVSKGRGTDTDVVNTGRCLLELFEMGSEVVFNGRPLTASQAVEMMEF
jgi:hypothetical protein